jgi:hypothetical protein
MTNAVNIAQGGSNNVTMRNRIINGAMVIDQRNAGASLSSPSAYTVDRWFFNRGTSTATYTVQQSSTAPAGFKNSLAINVSSGVSTASGQYSVVSQQIEGYNIADLMWGTANAQSVTLSFWVRSSLTGTFGVCFRNNNGDRNYIASYTINSANTFEYKTVTVAGDTSGTWETTNGLGIQVLWDMGVGTTYSSTAGAWTSSNVLGLTGGVKVLANTGASWYLTGAQFEAGTTASPFEYRQYGTELGLCQRYYEKSFAQGTAPAYNQAFNFSTGTVYVGTSISIPIIQFKVTKRAAPTMVMYGISTSGWRYYAGGFSNLSAFDGLANDTYFYAEGSGTSGLSQYQSTIIGGNWTASAEL